MNSARKVMAGVGMLLGVLAISRDADAQGVVAFSPTIGTVPDGAFLSVRPVVSADRRYVRLMDLNPVFIDVDRFDTFTIPAAVGGGGNGGLGGFPGLGGGGGGGFLGAGGIGGAGAGGGPGLGFNSMGVRGNSGALTGFANTRPLSSFVVPAPNPPTAKAAKTRKTSRKRTR